MDNEKLMLKRDKILLSFGGFFFVSIGLYHTFLPFIWNWEEFSSLLPDLIEWALYAINFLLSSLMIILGLVSFKIVYKGEGINSKNNLILFICFIFWVLNLGYQIFIPTPIPSELIFLKIGFLIPPAIGSLLYAIPLFRKNKNKPIL